MAVTVAKETSELRAAAFVLPLAATVGWTGAHKLAGVRRQAFWDV